MISQKELLLKQLEKARIELARLAGMLHKISKDDVRFFNESILKTLEIEMDLRSDKNRD